MEIKPLSCDGLALLPPAILHRHSSQFISLHQHLLKGLGCQVLSETDLVHWCSVLLTHSSHTLLSVCTGTWWVMVGCKLIGTCGQWSDLGAFRWENIGRIKKHSCTCQFIQYWKNSFLIQCILMLRIALLVVHIACWQVSHNIYQSNICPAFTMHALSLFHSESCVDCYILLNLFVWIFIHLSQYIAPLFTYLFGECRGPFCLFISTLVY